MLHLCNDVNSSGVSLSLFIAGHTHADMTFSVEGIPVILVDSMQKGSYPTSDLIYVNYDERKVYLKRIGDGPDRVVDLLP